MKKDYEQSQSYPTNLTFPALQTVYSFFGRGNEKGLWDKILEYLVKMIRKKAGRNTHPSYALIDSQSVKTAYVSEQIGFDGEKTKGRKGHIATDTLSCILALKVHKANLHDTKAGMFIARKARSKYPTIQKFCGAGGYRGSFVSNAKSILGLGVDISLKIIP